MSCSEFHPERDAPRSVTERLKRFGGTNPYGEPIWRLCLSDHRYDMRSGVFQKLPSGDIKVFTPNPDGTMRMDELRGITVQTGTYPVKKWPVDGWILERWYPCHMWGTREWWESQVAADGITRILGEYPVRGDYWMQCGPWPRRPDLDDIEQAIARFDWEMNNRPADIGNFIKSEIATADAKRVAKWHAYEEEIAQYMRSEIAPLYKSGSLEASRVRQEMARAVKSVSHVGL